MRLPSLKFLKTFQVAAQAAKLQGRRRRIVRHAFRREPPNQGARGAARGRLVRTRRAHAQADRCRAHYLEHISDIFAKLESVTEQLQVRYGRTIIRLNVPPFFANELLLPRLATLFPGPRRNRYPHRDRVFRAEDPSAGGRPVHRASDPGPGRSDRARAVRADLHRRLFTGVPAGQSHQLLRRSARQNLAGARRAPRGLGDAGRPVWESSPSSPIDWCVSTPCRRWCWLRSRASALRWCRRG